jgi:hypothetical protein
MGFGAGANHDDEGRMTSAEERIIANEIATELAKAVMWPALPPESLVQETFDRVFDRFGVGVANESSAKRILDRVGRLLAKAELNRQLDAAMRQRKTP